MKPLYFEAFRVSFLFVRGEAGRQHNLPDPALGMQ